MFVEPYVEQGRHVEVQVLGHRDGVLVLGERDCSIQRRHQKVIEEAPAPNLAEATRSALHEAARAAAAAIDYRGAGTVEFLYDAETERFFFLEMNTRLQVEHPVTELVHGVDLVEHSSPIAEGRWLDQRVIGETYGHSIEVRLYAEDPAHDWQPQSGVLTKFEVPGVAGEFDLLNRPGPAPGLGLRVGQRGVDALRRDARQGDRVGAQSSGGRPQAGGRSRACQLHGVVTNRDLLVASLRDDAFLRETSAPTSSTDGASCRQVERLTPDPHLLFAAAVALAERGRLAPDHAGRRTGRLAQRGLPAAAHGARGRRGRARRRVVRRP